MAVAPASWSRMAGVREGPIRGPPSSSFGYGLALFLKITNGCRAPAARAETGDPGLSELSWRLQEDRLKEETGAGAGGAERALRGQGQAVAPANAGGAGEQQAQGGSDPPKAVWLVGAGAQVDLNLWSVPLLPPSLVSRNLITTRGHPGACGADPLRLLPTPPTPAPGPAL